MTEEVQTKPEAPVLPSDELLRGLIEALLDELKSGAGDRDGRGQVDGWLRALAEKYPEYAIEGGLRDYYVEEARRLRSEFNSSDSLEEKLNLGRLVESFLEKASEIDRLKNQEEA